MGGFRGTPVKKRRGLVERFQENTGTVGQPPQAAITARR